MIEGYEDVKFRSNLVPLLAGMVALLVLVDGIVLVMAISGGMSADRLASYAMAMAVVSILYLIGGLFVFALVNYFIPITMGPMGIRTYNGLGLQLNIPWEAIKGTSKLTFFPGVRWLILKHGPSALTAGCIPTFVNRPTEFHKALMKYAGESHPLTVEFRKYAK